MFNFPDLEKLFTQSIKIGCGILFFIVMLAITVGVFIGKGCK